MKRREYDRGRKAAFFVVAFVSVYLPLSTLAIHLVDAGYPFEIFEPGHSIYHVTQPLYYNAWVFMAFAIYMFPSLVAAFVTDMPFERYYLVFFRNLFLGFTVVHWVECMKEILDSSATE